MEKITLQQIEIFLNVARCHNISKTAKKMYISQPAISNWIRDLEEQVGSALFVRTNRGVDLSPKGMRLFGDIDPVYQRFRISMENILYGEADPGCDILRVGSVRSPEAMSAMMAFTDQFCRSFPEIPLKRELYNYWEIREKLLCGELDAAFTMSFDIDEQYGFESYDIGVSNTYFVVPAQWNTVESGTVKYDSLRQRPLILEVTSGWKLAADICRDHGFEPSEIKFCNSYLTLSNAVANGKGFTLCQYFTETDTYLSSVKMLPAPLTSPGHAIRTVLVRREGNLRPRLDSFIDFCLDSRQIK